MRHDGSPCTSYDKRSGRSIEANEKDPWFGFFGRLMEVRGDWMNYKTLFGFKGWAGEEICWACKANKSSMPFWDFGINAAWRKCRHTTFSFVNMMTANGIAKSALFDAPGFLLQYIMVDVLHCLDLGVTQDAIGNLLFLYICSKFVEGKNRDQKLNTLWSKIKAYYKVAKPPTTISAITKEMIQRKGKAPKFKAKGAETRHLVPFAYELSLEIAEKEPTALHEAIHEIFKHLLVFYQCFGEMPFNKELASHSARSCLLIYSEVSKMTEEKFL